MQQTEVQDKLQQLVDAMKQTDDYRRYAYLQKQLEQDPEKKAKLDQLRRRNYELQCSGENLYERVDELEQTFAEMRLDPVAAGYLDAENAVCKMIRETLDTICSGVPVDIPIE